MTMNPWRMRKVRNGRVKIDGQWWKPTDREREYNGEMDGGTYLFARYRVGEQWQPYICLWGSKETAEAGRDAVTSEEMCAAMSQVDYTNKNIIDGKIYWI